MDKSVLKPDQLSKKWIKKVYLDKALTVDMTLSKWSNEYFEVTAQLVNPNGAKSGYRLSRGGNAHAVRKVVKQRSPLGLQCLLPPVGA